MIPNSGDILYLFDFDGTLFGRNDWVSYRVNNRAVRQNGPFIIPNDHNIKWYIFTARPKIDKIFVWYICHSRGLHPERIITYPTWFYPKDLSHEGSINFKIKVFKDLLTNKATLPNQTCKYSKIFYIDNDLKVVSQVNGARENYPIQAMTVLDFQAKRFNFIL